MDLHASPDESPVELKRAEVKPPEPPEEESGLWGMLSGLIAILVVLALIVAGITWILQGVRWLGSMLSIPAALAGLLALLVLFGWMRLDHMIGSGKQSRLNAHTRDLHLLLRRSRCPACGYSIANQRVEADGCVLCPECGAAWNAPAFLEEYPFDEAPPLVDDLPVIVDVRSWKYSLHARHKSGDVAELVKRVERQRVGFWPDREELGWGSVLLAWFGGLALTGAPRTAYVTSFWVSLCVMRWFLPHLDTGRNKAKAAAWIATDDVRDGRCPCCDSSLPPDSSRFLNARICAGCGGAWPASRPVRAMHANAPREYPERGRSM